MSKITIIQILRKPGIDYKKIIRENTAFLERLNLEYIIYDNLKTYEVLEFIKENNFVKYFRKDFKSVKHSMLESGMLANGINILYLKSDDILTNENVERVETTRPGILRKDLKKIADLTVENFKYHDFDLVMKEKKNFFEKFRVWFRY